MVDLLLGLMSSHDTRYQQDKQSSRHKSLSKIALMYLPLLTVITTNSLFLNLLKLDFENTNDTVKNKNFNHESNSDLDSKGYKSEKKSV